MGDTILIDVLQLASLLRGRGGAWATLAVTLLGALSYAADTLCTVDPPAQPTITADEYRALLQLSPWNTLQSAVAKLKDLVTIALWYEFCECATITTPVSPPALWTPPTNTSSLQVVGACPQPRARVSATAQGAPNVLTQLNNVTAQMFPGMPLFQGAADANHGVQDIIKVDPSWLTWRIHATYVSGIQDGLGSWQCQFFSYDANKVQNGVTLNTNCNTTTVGLDPPGGPLAINHTLTQYVAVNTQRDAAEFHDGVMDVAVDINCTSGLSVQSGCCTDPAVTALLQHLIELATLQQRWRLPFAFVVGAPHAVSGSGSFAVSRKVGLRILVTAIPAGTHTAFGTPPYQFNLGWISVSDADGMVQELRITRTTQDWVPPQMQLATLVGYALQAGVTATITELAVEA